MRILTFLMLGFCAPIALAQPDAAPKKIIAPTPAQQIEKVVRDFVDDMNVNGYISAQQKIHGARRGFFGANIWAQQIAGEDQFELKIESIAPPQINGDDATVVVNYRLNAKKDDDGETTIPEEMKPFLTRKWSETLRLKLAATIYLPKRRTWQIVTPDTEPATPLATTPNPSLLTHYAFRVAQKPAATLKSWPEVSLSNLQQLGLAARQFIQDFDEQVAFAPEHMQEALLPYTGDKSVFYIPGSYEPYAFNANLSEQFMDDFGALPEGVLKVETEPQRPYIKDKARTVMFYEGRDGKLTFRYDGKAAIGFADGKAALVSPEEAKNLIWKP
jgi:hypothetical protein